MRFAVMLLALCANAQEDWSARAWTGRVDAVLDRMIQASEKRRGLAGSNPAGSGSAAASLPAAPEEVIRNERRENASLRAIERVLASHGLSSELIAVAQVESALNPLARSPKGAVGMWQLMPDTARRFGLSSEDRTDAVRSTVAAARLLRYLYSRFGDWRLALAAYNAGEGAVQRAIQQAGSRDFAEITRRRLLSEETLRYVPKVAALRETQSPVEPQAAAAARIVWARPQ
jgi:membrane-bound lytic murein transglycosylase D